LSYLPSKSMLIYGTVSQGFSPPSISETLTPSGQINSAIKPEIGWNIEMGTRGELFHNRFSFDASVYSMHIRNLLVARRTSDDQYVGINAGKTLHNGIELALKSMIVVRPNLLLSAKMNGNVNAFSFVEFKEETPNGLNDFSGNSITGAPKWQGGFVMDMTLYNKFYSSASIQGVSKMPTTDDNTTYSSAYKTVNLMAGIKTRWNNKFGFDLSYRVNNLLNEKYASMLAINARGTASTARYYYPGLPTNHQVCLKLDLGW
jgi:iron complex outermembrane recepter protein